jgi:hypothetical protein
MKNVDSIISNPDMVYALTDFAYTKDKNNQRIKKPQFENQSDAQIIQGVIDNMWRRGNAVQNFLLEQQVLNYMNLYQVELII